MKSEDMKTIAVIGAIAVVAYIAYRTLKGFTDFFGGIWEGIGQIPSAISGGARELAEATESTAGKLGAPIYAIPNVLSGRNVETMERGLEQIITGGGIQGAGEVISGLGQTLEAIPILGLAGAALDQFGQWFGGQQYTPIEAVSTLTLATGEKITVESNALAQALNPEVAVQKPLEELRAIQETQQQEIIEKIQQVIAEPTYYSIPTIIPLIEAQKKVETQILQQVDPVSLAMRQKYLGY